MILLNCSGAMAVRAGPEAVESGVPVNPAKPAMPDVYLPAVTTGALITFPEEPLADGACPAGYVSSSEPTLACRLGEPDQPAGSEALGHVVAGTRKVIHRNPPLARSEPDYMPGLAPWPSAVLAH